ncbi:TBC/Rab GTPase activating domain containing protein [Entamoeba marina]
MTLNNLSLNTKHQQSFDILLHRKKPLPPIPSKKPLPQQPILNRSDTIELEESVTPKEDFEDIAVFRDCYIKLDICKIYGVLCLSQKRQCYYLNYIPLETINVSKRLIKMVASRTLETSLDSYRYSICLSTLGSFQLIDTFETSGSILLNLKQAITKGVIPTFEFRETHAREIVNALVTELQKLESLKVVKDMLDETTYLIYHLQLERVKTALLGDISPMDRLSRPDLIKQRESLILKSHIEGTNPLSLEILEKYMDVDGRISDENMDLVRKTLFYRGCEENAREMAWSLCLGYLDYKATKAERAMFIAKRKKDYESIKSVWFNTIEEQQANWKYFRDTKSQIAKDVRRTDRTDSKFKELDGNNCTILTNVLMSYAFYNMRLGYGQGMNDICAQLMDVVREETTLFWVFKEIMDALFPYYYCKNDSINKALNKMNPIMRLTCPELVLYFQRANLDYFFCFKWIALLFKRFFCTEDIIRLWDSVFAFPDRRFYYFICVAIVKEYANNIISKQFTFDEMFIFIQSLSNNVPIGIIFDADIIYQEFMHFAAEESISFVYEDLHMKEEQ